MKTLNSLVISIAGLGFVGFGIIFLCWPEVMLPGIGIVTPDLQSQIEIRAMYGGLELGLGILILSCFAAERQRFGLQLSLASYGGLGFARAASMLVMGVASPFLWVALIWEGVIAALALLALRNQKAAT